MRKIDLIVLHRSATREDAVYTPEKLECDHKARRSLRAGYNPYVRRNSDGQIRPDEWIKPSPCSDAADEYKQR